MSSASWGVLIFGHGSPRSAANEGFVALVERVARRLGAADVLPAFFSIASPTIPDQVGVLAARGIRRIVLLPYFLYTGQHITKDVPEILAVCRRQFPDVALELLATLEDDRSLEDVVVERLLTYAAPAEPVQGDGPAIQRRSFEIIEQQLAEWSQADPAVRQIVRRVVHATADFSFIHTMRIHPEAVRRALDALAQRKPILCDVKMLAAGITRAPSEVLTAIGDADVAAAAAAQGTTRAAAAMEKLAPRLEGAIVAIGNAPTALERVIEIARRGGPRPAVVVGLPVGLVGARESKVALVDSGLCYITNSGARGGSPAAAAAVNALVAAVEEETV
jgi:precorrin-8X/cobalt-precorrin-8 methylmutase